MQYDTVRRIEKCSVASCAAVLCVAAQGVKFWFGIIERIDKQSAVNCTTA